MRGHLKGALFAPLSDRFEMVTGSYIEGDSSVCLIVTEGLLSHAVITLSEVEQTLEEVYLRVVENGQENLHDA